MDKFDGEWVGCLADWVKMKGLGFYDGEIKKKVWERRVLQVVNQETIKREDLEGS